MTYSPPPIFHARAELERLTLKTKASRRKKLFSRALAAVGGVALLVGIIRVGGIRPAFAGLRSSIRFAADHPVIGGLSVAFLVACLVGLHYALKLWLEPEPKEVKYLPYPPLPDLTDANDIYIGSGWSVTGKQPGDVISEDDEPLFEEPHAIIPEKGLFGNIHITGAVGGGKTSTGILPILAQSIGKFHLPPPPNPDSFPNGKVMKASAPRRAPPPPPFIPLPPRRGHDDTYAGLTYEEARRKYARMSARWQEHKWGVFLIDPKGDMTGVVEQVAAYYGRESDVRALRPGGRWTVNPLNVSDRSLVQAELVLEGVEAVSGQTIQQFYRTIQTEWLGYAIEILKAVDPKRKTFEYVLAMARSESFRTELVAQAEQVMRTAQEEEARLRRLGQRYTGPRVDSQAIAFFREFDGEDSDPRKKSEVTQGIKAQAKYFTADEMIDFLCPKLPPTFEGFPEMIDKGLIVVLQMPPSEFGPVGRVNGILMMSDAMQAARERILRPEMNQKRVLMYIFDEVQNYLNKALRDFLAMNRQSRVCVVASHQSQSQLIQQHDRSAEFAFNDNLRNKIAYQAPNADAATKLSTTIGKRTTFVQRWSESASLDSMARAKDQGHDSGGASVSIAETETPWFQPEKFITLGMGEIIVRLWDGTRTANPRKLEAFPYYQSSVAKAADTIKITSGPELPHPFVLATGDNPSASEYLLTALDNTGYVLLLPLTTADGDLAGWWWTTAAGTIVLGLDLIEQLGEALISKMLDSPLLFVTPLPETVKAYFGDHLGADIERLLVPKQITVESFAAPDVQQAYQQLLDLEHQIARPGTWDAVNNKERGTTKRLGERGRELMLAFERLGAWMAHHSDQEIEDWIAASTKPRLPISLDDDDDPTNYTPSQSGDEDFPAAPPPDSASSMDTEVEDVPVWMTEDPDLPPTNDQESTNEHPAVHEDLEPLAPVDVTPSGVAGSRDRTTTRRTGAARKKKAPNTMARSSESGEIPPEARGTGADRGHGGADIIKGAPLD